MTIGTLKPGGFADKAKHDTFCGPRKDCVILSVLDQSPMQNHLTQRHGLVNASRHPITVGDNVGVYGMWFDPGFGYHVDDTRGIATGNEPESIYAVMSGSRHTGADAAHKGCCFDYGNSEDSRAAKNLSVGSGAMEAIYFGDTHWMQNAGDNTTVGPDGVMLDGPWVGADLASWDVLRRGEPLEVQPAEQAAHSAVRVVVPARWGGRLRAQRRRRHQGQAANDVRWPAP